MKRVFPIACLLAGSLTLIPPAAADIFTYIFHGKVVTEDGSAPPKQVGIERVCSDVNGTAPGPLTNKMGEYTWRMDLDSETTRACFLHAILAGYVSSAVEINFNEHSANIVNVTLANIVLTSKTHDPKVLVISNEGVPTKSIKAWKEAMQHLDNNDYAGAAPLIEQALAASPKFTRGWDTLGLVYADMQKFDKAQDAFRQALEVDPKYLPAQVMLDRLCARAADWKCVTKVSADIMKLDAKKAFLAETLMHQAAAQLETKDLAGAEATIQESIDHDPAHQNPRAEYVLGRILEAKGDANGAKQHMTQYLQLAPGAADAAQIRAHIQLIGTASANAGVQPALEIP